MSKKTKKNSAKPEKALSLEEQLERENELLRLEVAYLNNLKAFQENSNAFLEKHKQRCDSEDPDREWKSLILALFEKYEGFYGYHQIHLAVQAVDHVINYKKVQSIMNELNLKCGKFIRKSRYKSY